MYFHDGVGVGRFKLKDDLKTSVTPWKNANSNDTSVKVTNDYVYYASTGTAIARLEKATGAGFGSSFPLNTDETIVGRSLNADTVRGNIYFGTTRRRMFSAVSNAYRWAVDLNPGSSASSSVYNIFSTGDEVAVLYDVAASVPMRKNYSYLGAKLDELEIKASLFCTPSFESQVLLGRSLLTLPNSNIVAVLKSGSACFLKKLKVQS